MPPDFKPPSIHAFVPPESGGATARNGFMYQDHIAVCFFVEMLAERRIEALRCEAHDDLSLIWNDTGVQEVEFVQVKSDRRDSLSSPCGAVPPG